MMIHNLIKVRGADFCDDQFPIISTIGRGPKGDQGDAAKLSKELIMPYNPIDFPYIDDFCDDEVYVFSTIGQGPEGPEGPEGKVDEQLIKTTVNDWLNRHPEATTTVHSITSAKLVDNSITSEKLAEAVQNGYVRTFDTVADMQAATDLKAGMTAHTNGFHETDDGGAAYYTISTNGTANDMDVLELQNSLYATLVITEPYVTPEMFGAYGDGTNDDSAYLMRAMEFSDVVKLLSKTYYIAQTISMPKDTHLSGTGMKATVLAFASSLDWCIVFDGASQSVLEKLTVTSIDTGTINAIHFTNNRVWYTKVSNIDLRMIHKGIVIDCPTGYNLFEYVQFTPNAASSTDAVFIEIGSETYSEEIQPNYIYFDHCYFANWTGFGSNQYKNVRIFNGQHLKFTNCDFVASNTAFQFEDGNKSSRNIEVCECWFFAPFTIITAVNSKAISNLYLHDNIYVVQVNTMKMLAQSGNGYFNYLIQRQETILNAGGSLASIMYEHTHLYQPDICDFYCGFPNINFFTTNTTPTVGVDTLPKVQNVSDGSATITIYPNGLGYLKAPTVRQAAGNSYTITYNSDNTATLEITGNGLTVIG